MISALSFEMPCVRHFQPDARCSGGRKDRLSGFTSACSADEVQILQKRNIPELSVAWSDLAFSDGGEGPRILRRNEGTHVRRFHHQTGLMAGDVAAFHASPANVEFDGGLPQVPDKTAPAELRSAILLSSLPRPASEPRGNLLVFKALNGMDMY